MAIFGCFGFVIFSQPVDIDDYEDLHAFPIKTPDSTADFDEDHAFARQRLQGTLSVDKSSYYS